MPFAAYWALITSAATSLYSIIAFISLTWCLCPHQISPFWLCPLFLYKVSTLHGELSSSNLSSFSWLLPSTFALFPCISFLQHIMGFTRAQTDQALKQWFQPGHLDLAWGKLIYTPASHSKCKKNLPDPQHKPSDSHTGLFNTFLLTLFWWKWSFWCLGTSTPALFIPAPIISSPTNPSHLCQVMIPRYASFQQPEFPISFTLCPTFVLLLLFSFLQIWP